MLNNEEFCKKIYKDLCEEFGADFLKETEESVFDRKITARDIVKLSAEKVDAIQKEYDKENCREIFKAFLAHEINQDEAVFLLNYYRDGMSAYREVYRGLYEIYNIPEQIACMDQQTGVLETNIQKVPHVDAKNHKVITIRENVVANYTLKEVTPFTCMRLEYRDNENNPVFVILPVMKKAKRAIEKIKDYRLEYINENYPEYRSSASLPRELEGVNAHLKKVKDILRLTVTRKYYYGVNKTRNTFTRAANLGVRPEETRSLFYGNDMKNSEQLKKNGKNYYDEKVYFHLSNEKGLEFMAEAQIKIDIFYRADLQTHLLYEEQRRLEERLKAERERLSSQEVQRTEYRIMLLKKEIQKINKEANHEYNMMVLEKVRWLEDGYRALRIPPDYQDGTYKACHELIKTNYMVRPHKAFDYEKEFDTKDKTNIKIAARGGYDLKNIFEISQRYKEPISQKYSKLHNGIVDKEGHRILHPQYVDGHEVNEELLPPREYPNYIPGTSYDSRKDKDDWDGYGKARIFRADMNRNIYKNNYDGEYWQDYDEAEKELKTREKKLTGRQIRMYHKTVSKKRKEIEISLNNEPSR